MACDIFEKNPFRPDLEDDPGDIGPQVALVAFAKALAGGAEWLAGVSGKDRIDRAPQRFPIERSHVAPDRRWREISGALGGDDPFSRYSVPFHPASRLKPRLGEHEAHIQTTGSGRERQSVARGAWIHVTAHWPPGLDAF